MAKEEEFAMIEEFEDKVNLFVYYNNIDFKQNDNKFVIKNQENVNYTLLWNKHELKAFIDELLVIHSKMK